MAALSQAQGYLVMIVFAVFMIAVTLISSRKSVWTSTQEGFLYAGRSVGTVMAAFSIAASWIWAPALFVSVQKAYELGLPGIFWFTAPNVLAVVIFAFIGPAIRSRVPGGFSVPDWIRYRFSDEGEAYASLAHKLYLIPYIWYQVMAVTVQIFVGGMILNFFTAIPLVAGMVFVLAIVLSYSLIAGLRASIVTDFVHLIFILGIIGIVVPWAWFAAGPDSVMRGLGGIAGNVNIFDPKIAFSFGIVTSIGLIAGSIADQQFWQRVFAIKRENLVPSFVLGGLLFGIVPIVVSVLGFIAADPQQGISMPAGTGLPMIGVATVLKLLPLWVCTLFVFMLLCGLSSALDSGFAAIASLYAVDLRTRSSDETIVLNKTRLGEALSEREKAIAAQQDPTVVRAARFSMVVLAFAGLMVAFFVRDVFPLDRLWWIFNGIASIFVVPTVLSIYWDRLSAKGVIIGIIASLIAMIAFIYGNYVQDDVIVVFGALAIVGVNLLSCFIFSRKVPWTHPKLNATKDYNTV
ncbi:hypothetical protein GJ654_12530 [Rhodoblastus acidophilus]|uniref:Na+/proline symporter n=1 Tax=Rhodoblastus acidophilus TaxID=1074 RepID=A0A6N8DMK0_RHOAC|nr:hypothetical protein [Rhodoblastus acidophilus]MCW2275295.1 Na+/proline symporter [Rhodoblastus acidophilus]MTV31812.1 hypothetical protein [Rhodoblastus acidophilus]